MWSPQGSPDCYEYCELADQLAALMEMLASLTGRTRHRRSNTNDMEELVMNNLYTAFIDLEDCIQFSDCNADKIKFVHTALSGISQGMKTLGPQSREFMARIMQFNTARLEQVDRALQHFLPYNCSMLGNRTVLGEEATLATCLVFKAELMSNIMKDKECDAKFSEIVLRMLKCKETENTCSRQVWFEEAVSLLQQVDCVSAEAAIKAAGIIRDRISSLF